MVRNGKLSDVGPLRPVLRYCNVPLCNGVSPCIMLNCGYKEMVSEDGVSCTKMSHEVRAQLLNNSEMELPGTLDLNLLYND